MQWPSLAGKEKGMKKLPLVLAVLIGLVDAALAGQGLLLS